MLKPIKHINFQKMSVGDDLYQTYLDGKDIVLRALYSNATYPEIRISGARIKKMLYNEAKSET